MVTITGENFGPSIGAVQGTSGVSFNGVWATASSWSDAEIGSPSRAGPPHARVAATFGWRRHRRGFQRQRRLGGKRGWRRRRVWGLSKGWRGSVADSFPLAPGFSEEDGRRAGAVGDNVRVAVPPGAATGIGGTYLVTVSGQASNGVEFTVTGTGGAAGPAIGTVSPALGPEGTVVTVRGANFGPAADMGGVSFNGVWASAEQLERYRDPGGGAGGWDDRQRGGDVQWSGKQWSGLYGDGFRDGRACHRFPVVQLRSGGDGGDDRGENFGPSIGALQGTSGVSFNGVWASPTYWSETQIQDPGAGRRPERASDGGGGRGGEQRGRVHG